MDGYDYATACRFCGKTYYPNMYGMGRCSGCGYQYHPMDKVHEMKLNENWHPPTKEQDVGMTDYEGGERIAPGDLRAQRAVVADHVPSGNATGNDPQVALAVVAKAILDGKLDKDLKDLEGVLLQRIRTRKEQTLALVQEVYGENYTINTNRSK